MQPSKLIVLLFLGASSALPDVIFSNFGSTPPGYIPGGYEPNRAQICFMPGACFVQDNEFAMGFSIPAGSTYELTGIRVPLDFSNGITDVDFTIAADASGKPGSPLETLTIHGLTTDTSLYVANSVLQPILSGGDYWLEARISLGDFGFVPWSFSNLENDSGLVSGMSGPFGPGGWSNPAVEVQAAFEIDGIAVPEPAFPNLLGVVVLAISTLRRTLRAS